MSQLRTDQLLRHVGMRQHAATLGRRFYVAALVCAAVYAVVLLVSRLFAVIPDVFEWWTLLIVPAVALLAALIIARPPRPRDAARLVDQRMATKDLFLTAAMIQSAPGEYQPLVTQDAEARAGDIRPATVVPFDPWSRMGTLAVALLALFAAATLLPQLDPFGKEAQRQVAQERAQRLVEARKATALRADALKKQDVDADNSKAVTASLDDLKKDFNQMKSNDPAGNIRRIQDHKQKIGQQWRDLTQKKLADALKQKSTAQRFGSMQSDKQRQWKQQMADGNAAGMQQELQELQQMAQEMAQTDDAEKREQLRQQMEQRLGELGDFASKNGSQGLNDAIARAMQQLDMAQMQGLSQQAMQSLGESLELSELEMQQLAQSMRDAQSLEDALNALQQAQNLNQMQPLDGEACKNCTSMSEYAEFYRKMMAQCQGQGQGQGQGNGGGMGGPGQGEGNIAPEDESIATDYKTERSQSALQAGRILMQWKTREVSDAGEVNRQYADSIDKVKQAASEAIVQEQVPPGYHDSIMQYFNDIDENTSQ